jgi:NitT/TauT family transport system substrate-binding protein
MEMALSALITRRAAVAGLAAASLCHPVGAADPTRIKFASTNRELFDNLPLYVAAGGGMFKAENLDVEITHFAGGGDVVRAVVSGVADMGMVGTSSAIIAAGKGEPLKIISAWTAPAYGIVWIVPTDSPIKTVKDLAGKKVGITRPGSITHTGMLAALRANDLVGQVELVPVGGPGDGWAMLKAGRVQATHHTAPDVYNLVDRGEARILFQTSDYLKDYQQGVVAALEPYLQKNAETARRFLRAIKNADDFIAQKPDEAAKLGSKGMEIPEHRFHETIVKAPAGFFRVGVPEKANFDGSMTEAMVAGALKEAPAYDKVVDRSFLP